MDSGPTKKIGSNESAFQPFPKGNSNRTSKKAAPLSINGHTVESLSESPLPKTASTTSFRSGATTAVETTPRELSSYKIQHSISSASLPETHSNSRNTSSSSNEKASNSSEGYSNKSVEATLAAIVSPTHCAPHRESVIHEGFRTFLREEMGSVLEYRIKLQNTQTVCQDFLKEWEKENEKEETPLKDALLHHAYRVFDLQAKMIQETEPFVDLDQDSLNKAINMPLPSAMARPWSRPRVLQHLQNLIECADDLNNQLQAARAAIHAIDPTNRDCWEKAAKNTLKALDYRLLAFTEIVNKENQVIVTRCRQSAKYADYAAQCWADAAKIPQIKAQYLQQATEELGIQTPHPILDSISEMMRLAELSIQKAATIYEQASLAASAPEEALRQQEENYNKIASRYDNAFGRFQDAAASFAIGEERMARLLHKEATASSRSAQYHWAASKLELSENLAAHHEKAAAFRQIAASYKNASYLFYKAAQKLTLADETEEEALADELFQESQEFFNEAMDTAEDAVQEQQALEATFPAEILAQLMAS